MADLVTMARVTAALPDLTAAQLAHLPTLISAASETLIQWLGQKIVQADYEEVYAVPSSGQVVLRQVPANHVDRVATTRTAALTITNTATTTNQQARVRLAYTGDVDSGITPTGIRLTRVASGVTTTVELLYEDYPTVQELADEVNATAGGWSATVATGFGAWASTELFGCEAGQGAFEGAYLDVFSEDSDATRLDRRTGVLDVRPTGLTGGVSGPAWGPDWGLWGWPGSVSVDTSAQVRVHYNAGYATVPAPIQQACVELISLLYSRLEDDPGLKSEKIGDYEYVADEMASMLAISKPVQALVSTYRDYRVI